MAQRADDIRHEIAETRAAMTAKLALLEERVRETVAGAQAVGRKDYGGCRGYRAGCQGHGGHDPRNGGYDPHSGAAGRRRHASLGGRDGGVCEGNRRRDRCHGAAHL